jgi:uncharacterized protein with HEPN domain
MLDAAREALEYGSAFSRDDLDANRMLMHSLVRCIEVIGEAANQMSDDGRAEVTGVPWSAIIGMRHRLAHGYFDIDLDRVWDTVTVDLPPLAAALRVAIDRD